MDIYNTEYTQAEGKKNGVLDDNLRKDREIAQIQRDNFRKAHRAGVKMVFGSDAGVMPHGQVGRQFATMVTYGMTPLEAIQAATLNGSQALGRNDVGVIEVGPLRRSGRGSRRSAGQHPAARSAPGGDQRWQGRERTGRALTAEAKPDPQGSRGGAFDRAIAVDSGDHARVQQILTA